MKSCEEYMEQKCVNSAKMKSRAVYLRMFRV